VIWLHRYIAAYWASLVDQQQQQSVTAGTYQQHEQQIATPTYQQNLSITTSTCQQNQTIATSAYQQQSAVEPAANKKSKLWCCDKCGLTYSSAVSYARHIITCQVPNSRRAL